jgi:hypothetical protein
VPERSRTIDFGIRDFVRVLSSGVRRGGQMSIAVEVFTEVNERLNAGEYDAIYDLMHGDLECWKFRACR